MLKFKFNIINICWLFIIPYVLIDSLSGFFSLSLGLDLKIALLFKFIILLFCFVFILKKNKTIFNLLLFTLLFLLSTSYYHFLFHGSSALSIEFVIAMKVFFILLLFSFAFEAFYHDKNTFIKNSSLCLNLGFWVVTINILSGYLGFGHPTYASAQVGFKGFFVAGNELSALFIVLSVYKLQSIMIFHSKFTYILYSLLVILVGVSIGTKSGMIFSLFLPFVLFVLNSKRPCFTIFLVFSIVTLIILALYLYLDVSTDLLPAFSKVMYNYNNGGIRTLIFSGRDVWVTAVLNSINDNSFFLNFFLGFGSSFINVNIGKYIVEIDPIDIYLMFGILPLFIMVIFSVFTFYVAVKNFNNPFGPAVLLANLGLFVFAITAGHVWTSGMIAISWGLLNVFSSANVNDLCLDKKYI